jgi:hypothetical protein
LHLRTGHYGRVIDDYVDLGDLGVVEYGLRGRPHALEGRKFDLDELDLDVPVDVFDGVDRWLRLGLRSSYEDDRSWRLGCEGYGGLSTEAARGWAGYENLSGSETCGLLSVFWAAELTVSTFDPIGELVDEV